MSRTEQTRNTVLKEEHVLKTPKYADIVTIGLVARMRGKYQKVFAKLLHSKILHIKSHVMRKKEPVGG